jgi:DNA-binding response OmpR family regulator
LFLIEDQKPLARSLQNSLTAEGITVEVSHTRADAEERIHSNAHDVILLSLGLAGDDGFRLLRNLRREGLTTPILAILKDGSIAERVLCLDIGADGFLTRPIHPYELAARARALVRRARPIYDPVVRIHDLTIDSSTRTVSRAGEPLRLTRREYALLQFLAQHRGQVCSRSLIFRHLYNDHDECSSNVVDVFVRLLRAKVDKGFAVPLILTKWGQGYMLRDEASQVA